MRKLVIGMLNKGFTLIEILVVVLIISITLGFTMLAFGDFGEKRRLQTAAEQFINTVKFAEHEALVEANAIGIHLLKNSYFMESFLPPNSWRAMPNKSIYRPQHFPKSTIITVESEIKGTPQIIIDPAGNFTPFTLHLEFKREKDALLIQGTSDGLIYITSAP